uniref:tRNA methyltransferase 9B (putative) n=1 Tax=Cebus imitator TaxID=2715852 RepID=A0A2K5RMS6_CEBIM
MDHEAAQLEKQHVHNVYESTAPYFNDLQSKAWPRVRQFLQEQKPGSLIADIGCGTGKYLKVNSQVHTVGCDYCGPLVEIARDRGCEVMGLEHPRIWYRRRSWNQPLMDIKGPHHHSRPIICRFEGSTLNEQQRSSPEESRPWPMELSSWDQLKMEVHVPALLTSCILSLLL